MTIEESLSAIARKIKEQHTTIQTEEGTKNAFIMPFIQTVLGYDVFDPTEVNPELVADIGTKKGEKVDYAILKEGVVQILIECKKFGANLDINHASQLFRYFSVTEARIAILTNGQIYQFYTDLELPNRMDDKPFLTIDLLDIDDNVVNEIAKITKSTFDVDSIISAAGELKYVSQIKKLLAGQLPTPDEEFTRFFASRIYDKTITQKVRDQFTVLVAKAFRQFIRDQANDRLKTAFGRSDLEDMAAEAQVELDSDDSDDRINTTIDEIEGYNIVRAIVRSSVNIKRIVGRDTQSYFGILLDDNNRKPICRLHFNRSQKYLGIFDPNKKEERHAISSVDDIFKFSDQLKNTALQYSNE